MIRNLKRPVATLLAFAILVSGMGTAFPRKAEAQWAVIDPTNLVQNTVSAISDAAGHVKDYVLDTLMWQVGNIAIQSMTKSLVNWINSGFQGSPAFVTDLKKNLRGVGDAVARQFFLELSRQDIATTPFQDKVLDAVRLGYYLHTSPESFYTRNPYTLNQVSANDKAFLRGDFSQGGFNAWFATVMNPQNNPYGAQMALNNTLTNIVSGATGERQQEISWNRGFLSWRGECKATVGDAAADQVTATTPAVTPGDDLGSILAAGGAELEAEMNANRARNMANFAADLSGEDPCVSYEVETPGSVIMEQLNTQLGSGVNRLISADEINEIVGALLNQLVLQVIGGGSGGGLRGVSQPSAGGGSSYLTRATTPSATESVGIANSFAATIARQRQEVLTYQANWEKIRAAAASAERCTMASPSPEEVRTRAANALVIAANALAALDGIQAEIDASNAEGGNQSPVLLEISQRYNELVNSGTLPSPEAIAEASTQSLDSGDEEPSSLYTYFTRLGNSLGCRLGEST